MAEPLLSPQFFRRLEQLELASKRTLAGRMKGDRRSKRRGSSVEFADHKPYAVGDDLRHIDWNVLLRLDQLFVKLFEEEEDLHFHVLLDTSASMGFGTPTKLDWGKQVAAALAFVGLRNNDRVVVSTFADELALATPASRGRHLYGRVQEFLRPLAAAGGSDFGAACKAFAMRHPGKGIVVVVSDLMDKRGYEVGLRNLQAKEMETYVVHVLAAEEIRPPLVGDLRLVDAEDGDIAEVTVSAPLLARYQANLNAFCAGAKEYCAKRGISYMFCDNQLPIETLTLTWLWRRGLLA